MDRQALMPPFRYFGGKTLLAPTIAEMLPDHTHYVEPFAGSLAVLLAKRPSRQETVNDLDGDLMALWRAMRDHPDEFQRLAALTPHSRAELLDARVLDDTDEIERARRVWVRLTQSRSHSMAQTGWKYVRASGYGARDLDTFVSRMGPIAERLRSVSLECRDALEIVQDYGTEPAVCLYVDPPYLGSTRTSNYRHELLGDQQHRDLADKLHDCKASVVLSGYDAPLYRELFGGWHRSELQAPTTLSGDTDRVEVLWSNVPIGEPDLFNLSGEASA